MASQPISNPGPQLPPETLDYIIDFLKDETRTLKECCIVSKSWIPRTRKHLFAHTKFERSVHLRAWKETFPNPSSSPAHHTRCLSVGCLEAVTATDGEEGGWIRSFANIEELKLWSRTKDWYKMEGTLTPFYNISSALKCLCLRAATLPSSQVYHLLCSFPRLEDLDVAHEDFYEDTPGEDGTILRSSTSPVLTGTLVLYQRLRHISLRLLDLPNGLRFRRIVSESWLEDDLLWMTALVKACSDTLEVIDVAWWMIDNPSSHKALIDFSDAMHLKDVSFHFDDYYVPWITETLKTITSNHKHLQRIKIYIPFPPPSYDDGPVDVRQTIRGDACLEWMDLDRILVQLWESHAIRTKVIYREEKEWRAICDVLGQLLPESTTRGVIELVNAL